MDNDSPTSRPPWMGRVVGGQVVTGTVNTPRARANLAVRKALAGRAAKLDRTHGRCYCCGLPWSVVSSHSTRYTEGNACFPLCQPCWRLLTPVERLPFYRQLWEDWTEPKVPWEPIAAAVAAGG